MLRTRSPEAQPGADAADRAARPRSSRNEDDWAVLSSCSSLSAFLWATCYRGLLYYEQDDFSRPCTIMQYV